MTGGSELDAGLPPSDSPVTRDNTTPKTVLPRTEPGPAPKTETGQVISKGAEVGTELAADTALFAGAGKAVKGAGNIIKKIKGIPIRIAKATDLAGLAKTTGKPLWSKDLSRQELIDNAKKHYMTHFAPKRDPANGKLLRYSVPTEKGEVAFRATDGWGKLQGDYSSEKMRLIPYVDDLLRTARYLRQESPRRLKHQKQGLKIHIFQNMVKIDGKKYSVEFTVREANNGKLFYELVGEKVLKIAQLYPLVITNNQIISGQ